jgi:hypothetical protein
MTQPCDNSHQSHYTQEAAIVSIEKDGVQPPDLGIAAHLDLLARYRYDNNFRCDCFLCVCFAYDRYWYDVPMIGDIVVYEDRVPVITEFNPSNNIVDLNVGFGANFNLTAEDRDGTVPTYWWYLDGVFKATGASWSYTPGQTEGGSHLVTGLAWDGSPVAGHYDTQIWTVNVHGGSTAVPGVPLPTSLEMSQNYPNPFISGTQIDFGVPQAGMVRMEAYDLAGARVRRLVDQHYEVGRSSVRWDGLDDRGNRVRSGVYFVRITAGGKSIMRRVVLGG